jgi:hypothetical protein
MAETATPVTIVSDDTHHPHTVQLLQFKVMRVVLKILNVFNLQQLSKTTAILPIYFWPHELAKCRYSQRETCRLHQ